ncbi:MAG: hypothetical protein DLM62_16905 [Pseudonocardiales bacterium]|nr:MAG: hypothetical protein DLM62_16905 [Pseudonocardiales bacterium]
MSEQGTTDPPQRDRNRLVLHVSCSVHGGPRGFVNLVVSKRDGEIELNPHVDGCCLLTLDETAATALFDQLGEWL